MPDVQVEPRHECPICHQIVQTRAMAYYTHKFVCQGCANSLKEGRLAVQMFIEDLECTE